ncbi:MAG: anti-sigma factor [Planctomycetes bacterium]|nr:anti-sigma factor [Planctomycetota bacterium]
MCCEEYKLQIGCLLDGETAPDVRAEVSDHIQTCAACRQELTDLQELASKISDFGGTRNKDRGTSSETNALSGDILSRSAPSEMWAAIERRIEMGDDQPTVQKQPPHKPSGSVRWVPSRRWTLAASLIFVFGFGLLGLNLFDSSAKASTINFAILLDGLPLDAQKAFRKFLAMYDAKPGSPLKAKEFAPALNFETPQTLPGGFQLVSVYLVQFGGHPGVAASYERDGEFLATIFHTPVTKEDFGTHKDYPCAIGKHHGHKVEVGSWKIVHLTDATTCHCVLSQLDEASALPAVMSAVAPRSTAPKAHDHGK